MAGSGLLYILNDTRRDLQHDLQYIAKVIKGYYDLSFHQWELSLLSVGNRLIEIQDPADRLAYANKALMVYEKDLLAFGLADTTGQVLTFTGRLLNDSLPNLRKSKNSQRSFDLGLKDPGISLGECYYFENVSDWILPVRVPIRDSSGVVLAINTSAIDYSRMMNELDQFQIGENYKVHLINNDFNTTQLYYPLPEDQYASILGSDSLSYAKIDTIRKDETVYILSGIDPLTNRANFMVCVNVESVNHRLIIAVDQSQQYVLASGRIVPVLLIYALLMLAAIILYRYIRKNLEQSILKSRSDDANFTSIVESTEDLIALFDSEKSLQAYNSAYAKAVKMSDKISLQKGMGFFEMTNRPDYSERYNMYLDSALSGKRYQAVESFPGIHGEIHFRFSFNPIRYEDKILGVSFFAENITEIREYQQKLEDYNRTLEQTVSERTEELEGKNLELQEGYKKLKSTQQQLIRAEKMASLGVLSAGIGHEINNPLNFIKNGSIALKMKLEKMELGSLDDLVAYFDAIDEGVRRASKIVSSLSGYSRSSGDTSEICDIHKILENSLLMLNSRFRDKSIEIQTEFHAQDPVVTGDSGKLHQVFTNIIANAEQAIAEKGFVKLSTFNEANQLVISIEDSGMGMSEAVLSKIMDPFFTTKEQGEGTGLGLFISQMIIDEHGGEMTVNSQEGKGTIFIIKLKQMPS